MNINYKQLVNFVVIITTIISNFKLPQSGNMKILKKHAHFFTGLKMRQLRWPSAYLGCSSYCHPPMQHSVSQTRRPARPSWRRHTAAGRRAVVRGPLRRSQQRPEDPPRPPVVRPIRKVHVDQRRGPAGGQRERPGRCGAVPPLFLRVSPRGLLRDLGAVRCRYCNRVRVYPAPRRPPHHPPERRRGRPRHPPRQLLRQPVEIPPAHNDLRPPLQLTCRASPVLSDRVPDPPPPGRDPVPLGRVRSATTAPPAWRRRSVPPLSTPLCYWSRTTL